MGAMLPAGGANNIVGTSTAASTGAADVRFAAKDVDYVMSGADLGQNNVVASGGAISAGTGELATFLSSNSSDRASAVAEAGLGDTTDAAIRLTGKIFFERGNYDFRVLADDGFRIELGWADTSGVRCESGSDDPRVQQCRDR